MQLVGTIISAGARAFSFGCAKSDQPDDWPFPGDYWRTVCPSDSTPIVRPGHPDNGSGAVIDVSDYQIRRSIEEWQDRTRKNRPQDLTGNSCPPPPVAYPTKAQLQARKADIAAWRRRLG